MPTLLNRLTKRPAPLTAPCLWPQVRSNASHGTTHHTWHTHNKKGSPFGLPFLI